MVSFAILRQCTFRIAILIYFVAMVSFFNIAMVSFCQIAMVSFNLLRTSVFRILLPGISRIATVIHFCCKMSYCEIELFLLRKCIFLLQEKMNAIFLVFIHGTNSIYKRNFHKKMLIIDKKIYKEYKNVRPI